MAKYRFDQIAINSTEKKKPIEEDRFTYLGLEHLDSGSLKVTRFGSEVAPIGEKLVMHKGDVLFGSKLISVSASDEFFSEKLHGPVYDENSGACRFILCMMAQAGMTQETYVDLWRQYDSKQYVWSIEHIFPQGANIPQAWVDMIAGGDLAKAQAYQAEYVHTFGNLTITGYNSTLSNKSFTEKRDRRDNNGKYIGYRNGLNLNNDVYDQDEWTVDIIKARTDRMVKEIMTMFAL